MEGLMSRSSIQRARILVVDDEPSNAALIRAMLATAGFDCVQVHHDPRHALDDLSAHEPDLVLLDLFMPGIDGVEFLRRMHGRLHRRAFVPVLVLTALGTPDALKTALQAGANDFLAKPLDADELLLRVQNLLSIRFCHQELLHHNAALARELRVRVRGELEQAADRERVVEAVSQVVGAGGPEIVFQPLVALATGRTLGVEALARFGTEPWRGPDDWFCDADTVGMGTELELAALRVALRQRDRLHPSWLLAVNVSPAALVTSEFAQFSTDVDLSRISFEITEHQAIADYGALRQVTGALQARGASISIDDAGAGYASLRHILKLHPDIIKLDISLTRDIDRDPVKRALATSLVRFADQIGAELTAEGIETANELDALRDLGVHYGQGYFIAWPARADALVPYWPSRTLVGSRPA